MSTLNLDHNKLDLIYWISELEDVNLIKKLKQIKSSSDLPQWQKDELDKRMKNYEENSDILLDISELDNHIKLK